MFECSVNLEVWGRVESYWEKNLRKRTKGGRVKYNLCLFEKRTLYFIDIELDRYRYNYIQLDRQKATNQRRYTHVYIMYAHCFKKRTLQEHYRTKRTLCEHCLHLKWGALTTYGSSFLRLTAAKVTGIWRTHNFLHKVTSYGGQTLKTFAPQLRCRLTAAKVTGVKKELV